MRAELAKIRIACEDHHPNYLPRVHMLPFVESFPFKTAQQSNFNSESCYSTISPTHLLPQKSPCSFERGSESTQSHHKKLMTIFWNAPSVHLTHTPWSLETYRHVGAVDRANAFPLSKRVNGAWVLLARIFRWKRDDLRWKEPWFLLHRACNFSFENVTIFFCTTA